MAQLARWGTRFLLLLMALVAASAAPALSNPTQARAAECTSTATPVGALPPAIPIWCEASVGTAGATFQTGPDAWRDDFGYGTKVVALGDGYTVFDSLAGTRSQHWRQNNHWMVDVFGTPSQVGGAMMRPNRSFQFQNGKLVIEAQVAAGIQTYGSAGGDAWPELVVSTASQPTGKVVDGLYAYGQFGGHSTLGCRLQGSREPICALYDSSGRTVFDGGRRFEISFFQDSDGAGASHTGGGPYGAAANAAWRTCNGTNPDIFCRDTFRWELTRDTLTLFVNGFQYMKHYLGSSPQFQLPDAMLNGPVYAYFADWVYQPGNVVSRFHWQHLAVNPTGSMGAPPGAPPADSAGAASQPGNSGAAPAAQQPAASTPDTNASAPAPAKERSRVQPAVAHSSPLRLAGSLAGTYWWALLLVLLLAGAGMTVLVLRSRSRVTPPRT